MKVGKWKSFYYSGNLQSESLYANDSLDGAFITYHPTGEKQEMTEFRRGKNYGKYEAYFENGTRKDAGIYQDR
jgi:antitoxin component YwqK of YwqJK toxin-antitoxin module